MQEIIVLLTGALYKRIIKGLVAGVYSQIITVIIQLTSVPILLYCWGPRLYGEWLILFAIPAYLSITDLGFSLSAANDMSADVAHADQGRALSVFQSLFTLICCVFCLGILLVSVVLWALPFERWVHLSQMSGTQARWILWLFAAEILVRLGEGVNHAGFRANGDYALHVALNSTTQLLQMCAVWIIALMALGPVLAAAGYCGVRLLIVPLSSLLLIRRHPWLHFGFLHARRSELQRLMKPAIANLAMPIAQALNIQGMILMIGAMLGPIPVVVFATLRTLARLVTRMTQAVSHAYEPEYAVAFGSDNRSLLRHLYIYCLRIDFWLSLAIALVLGVLGSFILRIWTDGKVEFDALLFYWLLISTLVSAEWYAAMTLLKSVNRHVRAAVLYCLSAGAAIVLAWGLLSFTGRLADAGLALLLVDAVMIIYSLRAASRLLGKGVVSTLWTAANPLPLVQLLIGKAHGEA